MQDTNYGKTWSLCPTLNQDEEEYYITYGFGYSKMSHIRLGLLQEQETFVPIQDNVKVSILRLKNTLSQKRTLKIVYYLKPVLGEDILKSDGYIHLDFDQNQNILYAKNQYMHDLEQSMLYVSSNLNIKAFTGDKNQFIGNGNLRMPQMLQAKQLNQEDGLRSIGMYSHSNTNRAKSI